MGKARTTPMKDARLERPSCEAEKRYGGGDRIVGESEEMTTMLIFRTKLPSRFRRGSQINS
jgi:hypothetical protein